MTGRHPTDPGDPSSPHNPEPEPRQAVYAETRWPMAGAVIAAVVLTLLLPDDLRLGPRWALPLLKDCSWWR